MKLSSVPKLPQLPRVPDPDTLVRIEWNRFPDGRNSAAFMFALTPKNIGRLVLSTSAAVGLYLNIDAALPLLKRFLLP